MQKWNLFSTFSQRLLRRSRQERGQALVEFAVVFSLLLLPIILGILYFGRYESYSNQETQMAESAARYASVNGNPGSGSLQSYIQAQAPTELQAVSSNVTSPLTVAIYCSATPCIANGTNFVTACVTATVSYPGLLGGTSTMLQKATMPVEQAQTAWTPNSGANC
jgi:Flp pilus assembly protein TadG